MQAYENSYPRFGGRAKTENYYTNVSAIIASLRPAGTLRMIADELNRQGLKTPRGLEWNKQRVTTYLRDKAPLLTAKEQ